MHALPLPPRHLTADRGDAGRRVDLVIRRHLLDLPTATRSRVQAWLEHGRVSINGRVVRRVSTRVALDDEITVELPDERPRTPVVPEEGQLDCLFEDDHLLVVDKPAGIVSHPTFLHPGGSLLNRVLWHARTWPSHHRPSLVGRLDKLTSGIVIVAKTTEAHARLQRTLASSFSEKRYLAVVYGPVTTERGAITLRLRRHPDDRRRVIATRDDGDESLTRFERLQESEPGGCPVALVRCQLVTGRMHQVRVHMAASGWPLVGDPKYGEPRWTQASEEEVRERLRGFPRQALHASCVAFVHPFTGEHLRIQAVVPPDMRALMEACGLTVPET